MPETCPDSKGSLGAVADIQTKQPYNCRQDCTIPWESCVSNCGGGSFCEVKCNCKLFKDPNSLCRKDGGELADPCVSDIC